MDDRVDLLHNMSAPPKSVVKYSGLADLAAKPNPSGSGVSGDKSAGVGVFGTPIRFALPGDLRGRTPAAILRSLKVTLSGDADRQLANLIDARASELPLPEGCVVIPAARAHRVVWSDTLSALAILTKCSDSVWLRAKSPSLNAALARRQATLLIPPQFTTYLPEVAIP